MPDLKILVTGAAGFIGYHTALLLLARGYEVVGLDNLNNYYDVSLKKARLALLQKQPSFRFEQIDLTDRDAMAKLFSPALDQFASGRSTRCCLGRMLPSCGLSLVGAQRCS